MSLCPILSPQRPALPASSAMAAGRPVRPALMEPPAWPGTQALSAPIGLDGFFPEGGLVSNWLMDEDAIHIYADNGEWLFPLAGIRGLSRADAPDGVRFHLKQNDACRLVSFRMAERGDLLHAYEAEGVRKGNDLSVAFDVPSLVVSDGRVRPAIQRATFAGPRVLRVCANQLFYACADSFGCLTLCDPDFALACAATGFDISFDLAAFNRHPIGLARNPASILNLAQAALRGRSHAWRG